MIIDKLAKKINEVVDYTDGGRQHNKTPTGAAAQSQQNLAGKLISKAGNFLKNDIYDDIKSSTKSALSNLKNTQPSVEKMDQQIMEVLINENRSIKLAIQKCVKENEELKERAETLKQLEEEAAEENEVLQFKVMSLEAQAQIEGKDVSKVKLVDEMRHSKKQLQKELTQLQNQVKSLESLNSQENSGESRLSQQDPKQALDSLRMLYDLYKVDLTEKQQLQLMTSLLVGDQALYQYFRVKLFQSIAKRAIEKSELLYNVCVQTRGNGNGSGSGVSSIDLQASQKVFIENKRLKTENIAQQQQIESLNSKIKQISQSSESSQKTSSAKLLKMKQKADTLKKQLGQIQNSIITMRSEAEDQKDFSQSYVQPNLQLLLTRIQKFNGETSQKVKEAHKAVFDKNKTISDLYMKNTTLEQQLKDNQQNNQLIYEKNKQIGDLFNQNNQLKQEKESLNEQINKLRQDNSILQLETLQPKPAPVQVSSQGSNNNQQWEEQKLAYEAKIEELNKEIKQMRHEYTFNSIKNAKSGSKEMEEYKTALIDKNKMISEMFNKQNDNMRIIGERDDEIEQLRLEVNKLKQGGGGGNQSDFSKQSTQRSSQIQNKKAEPPANDFFGGFFGSIKSQLQQQIFGEEEEEREQQQKPQQTQQYQQNQQQQKEQNKPDLAKWQQPVTQPQKIEFKQEQSISPPKQDKKPDNVKFEDDNDDFFDFSKPASTSRSTLNDIKPIKQNVMSFGGPTQQSKDKGQALTSRNKEEVVNEKKVQNKSNSQQVLNNNLFGVQSFNVNKQLTSQNLNNVMNDDPLSFMDEIQAPKPNLDFLEDMFTGLLGNTISNDLKSKNQNNDTQKKDDLNKQSNQLSFNSKPIKASQLPTNKQEITKQENKTINFKNLHEKPIQNKDNQIGQNSQSQNVGWQENEPLDIELDLEDDFGFNDKKPKQQQEIPKEKIIEQKNIDSRTLKPEQQPIVVQQKADKGWQDDSLDIELENEKSQEFSNDHKNIDVSQNQQSPQNDQSEQVEEQKVQQDKKEDEAGWQDEDLGIDDDLGLDDLIDDQQAHDDIFPTQIYQGTPKNIDQSSPQTYHHAIQNEQFKPWSDDNSRVSSIQNQKDKSPDSIKNKDSKAQIQQTEQVQVNDKASPSVKENKIINNNQQVEDQSSIIEKQIQWGDDSIEIDDIIEEQHKPEDVIIDKDSNKEHTDDKANNQQQNEEEQQDTVNSKIKDSPQKQDLLETSPLKKSPTSNSKQSKNARNENESTFAQKWSNYDSSSQNIASDYQQSNILVDNKNHVKLEGVQDMDEQELESDNQDYTSDQDDIYSPELRHLDNGHILKDHHKPPLSTMSNPHMTLQYDNDLKDVESQGWGQVYELDIDDEDVGQVDKQQIAQQHKYDILSNKAQYSEMRNKDLALFSPPSELKTFERGEKTFDIQSQNATDLTNLIQNEAQNQTNNGFNGEENTEQQQNLRVSANNADILSADERLEHPVGLLSPDQKAQDPNKNAQANIMSPYTYVQQKMQEVQLPDFQELVPQQQEFQSMDHNNQNLQVIDQQVAKTADLGWGHDDSLDIDVEEDERGGNILEEEQKHPHSDIALNQKSTFNKLSPEQNKKGSQRNSPNKQLGWGEDESIELSVGDAHENNIHEERAATGEYDHELKEEEQSNVELKQKNEPIVTSEVPLGLLEEAGTGWDDDDIIDI